MRDGIKKQRLGVVTGDRQPCTGTLKRSARAKLMSGFRHYGNRDSNGISRENNRSGC
ncbi:hypothetical protein KCP69_08850 [Salmonella enterica subsp. enterica]|nr:hypothetical protein KCP69_08850 [Salmonella enterica subsp. enterica]